MLTYPPHAGRPQARRIGTLALILALALAPASASAEADEQPLDYLFKGATPLELAPPAYPKRVLRDGGEGWVVLSFVIDETGRPGDIVVDDSAGAKPLRSAAIRAVEQWSFDPATLNGEPILQCRNRYMLSFKLNPPASGASPAFAARYKRASRALTKGKVADARKFADELKAYGVNNFYENAAYWHLRLQLAAKEQNSKAMRYAAGRLVALGPGYLPQSDTRKAALLRYKLLVQDNYYGEAQSLRDRFDEFAIDDDDPTLAAYHARLHAARTEIPAYGVKGRISQHPWSISLIKPSFYLEDVKGDIRDIEIRCDHHRESTAASDGSPERVTRRVLHEEKAWVIPNGWGGNCHVMVFGEEGTEFVLVQQSLADAR